MKDCIKPKHTEPIVSHCNQPYCYIAVNAIVKHFNTKLKFESNTTEAVI